MTRKKRILMNGEASFMLSGFGIYSHEVMSRLHATGKYELAEFATYGYVNDPRDKDLPWKYYANAVRENDPEHAAYKADPLSQFGKWRFERVLLDFKPDIVFDVRDYWMMSYANNSPFRPFFHWVIMPTVDSAPQKVDWIETYLDADGVFTYSDWNKKILDKESNSKIKTVGTASPGTDLKIFCPPQDIKQHRKKMSMMEDINLVGTVMRNQRRKLYPDLFIAFKEFLDLCDKNGQQELADKTYLYVHTSYPDVGWDIPLLIKENGIGHKVIFSYICRKCKKPSCAFFQDARAVCPFCKNVASVMPSVAEGLTSEQLADVYKMFDVYVQYAICMPKGEQVLVNHTWTNIEDVKVGDQAFTHNGRYMPVNKTFEHHVDEDIVELKCCGDYETIKMTQKHPAYGWFKSNITLIQNSSLRETIGHKIRNKQLLPEKTFLESRGIECGDLIAHPIDDTVQDITQIDLAKFADIVTDTTVAPKNSKYKYPRYIDVDNKFCRFIGLFAADGTWSKHYQQIQITSANHETQNINLTKEIFNRCANRYSQRKYVDRNAIDIMLYSSIHRQLIKSCKKHQYKQLPGWTLYLPTDKQKEVLQGMMMGDGCYSKKANVTIYCTISKTLADQLKHMLRRCRINFNATLIIKQGNRHPQYRFEITGNGKCGQFEVHKRKSTKNIYIANYHMLQVKTKECIAYSGNVYNFEVKTDNSYVSRLGAIHNCEGLGMPQVEAAACGVPVMAVDYSAMEDVVRNTKGVPIKVQRMFREADSHAWRALPDNSHLAQELFNHFMKPDAERKAHRVKVRHATEEHYNWDKTAKTWERYFDSVELKGLQGQWDYRPRFKAVPTTIPEGMDNVRFVEWIHHTVLQDPIKCHSYSGLAMLRDLNHGATIQGNKLHAIGREELFKRAVNKTKFFNECENARCNIGKLPPQNYIKYAELKESLR